MAKNPRLNEPDELEVVKIPDNTVTLVIKAKGKVFTKGLTLPPLDKDTPDEDVHMAMQRVKDVGDIGVNTVFYTLKQHGDKDVKPELV